MNGKGSKSRITDRKAFNRNFAMIQWRRRELDSACKLLCAQFETGRSFKELKSAHREKLF